MKPKQDIALITGSNGRIDTALMQRLRKRFDNVVGFVLKASTPPSPECMRITVDITSDESVQEGLRVLQSAMPMRPFLKENPCSSTF